MSRRITIVGLAALCALALSALGATGASAAETTAYTCVSGGTEFGNAHCSVGYTSGEGWHHVAITEETSLYLKSIGTTTLESEPFLALVKLSSSHVECLGCTAKNSGSTGAMEVSGSGGKLKFTGVIVTNLPTKCEVLSDPNLEPGVITTEALEFKTTGTAEVKISPKAVGGDLAHFWIKAIPGQKCLLERTYTVNGDVNGTTTGATLNVNVPLGTTLTVSGAKASLVGEATIEAGSIGSSEHHPAALT